MENGLRILGLMNLLKDYCMWKKKKTQNPRLNLNYLQVNDWSEINVC